MPASDPKHEHMYRAPAMNWVCECGHVFGAPLATEPAPKSNEQREFERITAQLNQKTRAYLDAVETTHAAAQPLPVEPATATPSEASPLPAVDPLENFIKNQQKELGAVEAERDALKVEVERLTEANGYLREGIVRRDAAIAAHIRLQQAALAEVERLRTIKHPHAKAEALIAAESDRAEGLEAALKQAMGCIKRGDWYGAGGVLNGALAKFGAKS